MYADISALIPSSIHRRLTTRRTMYPDISALISASIYRRLEKAPIVSEYPKVRGIKPIGCLFSYRIQRLKVDNRRHTGVRVLLVPLSDMNFKSVLVHVLKNWNKV